MRQNIYSTAFVLQTLLVFFGLCNVANAQEQDTLKFPFNHQSGGLFLENQIEYTVEYDAVYGRYILYPMIGTSLVAEPIYLSRKEYLDLVQSQEINKYYRIKSQTNDQYYRELQFGDKEQDKLANIIPTFQIKSKAFESIFGGSEISLTPQGYANIDLGVFLQKIDNPMLLPQNRNTLTIDLQQRMQLSVLGKVGENLQLKMNYDTQSGFAFENQTKLQWRKAVANKLDPFAGDDDILQNVELGNISMPLTNSLIKGSQSLFGVRTDLKFGNTNVTAVFSEQRSEGKSITVQGGGVMSEFNIFAENYEYNKHFFLGHYFRNNYDRALKNYPGISSQTNITRVEVWKIDRSGGNVNNRRSIIALRDLGEDNAASYPVNGAIYNSVSSLIGTDRNISNARNLLNGYSYNGQTFVDGEHYAINENVRKLDPSEYTFYPQLGYISLNSPLVDGDDLLAISYQYQVGNQVYSVGDMSDGGSNTLITKLIKPNAVINTKSPTWDLMMKNIYSLNAYGLDPQDFTMNIMFKDNGQNSSGTVNYLPNTNIADQTLLQALHMDRLNQSGQPQENRDGTTTTYGDGKFDFVSGITVDVQRGAIIFTTVEPFGDYLRQQLDPGIADQYVFDGIYTKLPATLIQEKLANRYSLTGRYKGTVGDGVALGAFNVPQGSVVVTANGQTLTEGVDYTVDYQLGRVKIINQQLKDSGTPINISMENQATFNLQKKRFIGLNAEHHFSEKFVVGATMVNYQERPVTQKTQFGSEAVNNTIFGVNTQINTQSEWLTRMANYLPGVQTEDPSNITFNAEGAYLLPGINKATEGYSYIDDFEDAQTNISLMDPNSWKFASTPGRPAGVNMNIHPYFPHGNQTDNLAFNNGRKMLSWYTIDPRFYGMGGTSPLSDNDISNHRSRRVEMKELFDQRDIMAGTQSYLSTFDMTFYPQLRGPYNINPNQNDTENWGATMRALTVSNLVENNVEYLEFWMMDPYADGNGGDGELLIHLGSVSEDILKDGELAFENGMPFPGSSYEAEETSWGKTPKSTPLLYTFETEGANRKMQDLGFNGLTDAEEATKYNFTDTNPITGELDPANDNYLFFLDKRYDGHQFGKTVQGRYQYYRNPQGNSSTDNAMHASSLRPDTEDINEDFNLDQTENYLQYTLKINRQDLEDPTNSKIVARKEVNVRFANGKDSTVKWYQVRIPVDGFDLDVDNDGVDDISQENIDQAQSVLTSARYMRMVMRGFQEETTLRFGTFDMVRSEWRRYTKNIYPDQGIAGSEGQAEDSFVSDLEIGEVNLEQNSNSQPRYTLPPGVSREHLQGATGYQNMNESSMTIKTKFRGPSSAKGVIKNVNLDLRRYKKIEMFVSAQNLLDVTSNQLDETTKLFIRFGSDYADNYYEYEIPLKYTPRSATSVNDIWPEENFISLLSDYFTDAKKLRDTENFVNNQRFAYTVDEANPNKIIYVKGRPTLGNVSSLMIGLRSGGGAAEKEVLVWVNELRLSDIDNKGGYAANASLTFNLGDFANVQLTGRVMSNGFGAVDQGPIERSQEDIKEYSVNVDAKLDKLMPKKWNMEVPFNFTMMESFIDPKYNPLDNDILMNEAPNKKELAKTVRQYTRYKSYSFSNIRKIRNPNNRQPQRFYDPSNFALSFSYADEYYRDIYTKYNINQNLRASLNYNYGFRFKSIEPFKNWHAVQDTAKSAKYLRFVKEFNINPVPTRFSFRTDINRTYTENQYRDLSSYTGGNSLLMPAMYSSNFLFGWQYNLGFDLTRSLRVDLTSSTQTLNDGTAFYKLDQNLIWQNMFSVGRPVNYDQQLQLNYKLPFRFLPYANWVNMEFGFTSSYNWRAYSRGLSQFEDENGRMRNLGNGTAQNSNTISLLGDFDFQKFYPEFKGYRAYDSIRKGRQSEIDSINNANAERANSKFRRRLNNQKFKFKNQYRMKDIAWMVLGSLKKAQFNYSQNNGAVVPGLYGEPGFFGMASDMPGFGFVYGTDFDIKRNFVERGYITNDELMLEPYQVMKSSNFTATALIEPMPDFRIDLDVKRNKDYRNYHSGFNLLGSEYNGFVNEMANLNISNISVRTAFTNRDEMYQNFRDNVVTIGGGDNEESFSRYDVILPAFVSAVEGKSASKQSKDWNRKIPAPNWRIAYTGLTNMPIISKWFDQVEISHSYQSSYTVTGVQSNIFYNNPSLDLPSANSTSPYLFTSVAMVEAFNPLIGVDVTLRNNFQFRAQYNRDRMLQLNFDSYTINEDYGNEIIAGFGYIFKDLKFKMRYQGRTKTVRGDLNVRGDFSVRDNESRLRKFSFGNEDSQIVGGQKIMKFMFSADYNLSQNLNIKFYWDQNISKYKLSTAYPISTIRTGLSATFTFGN